MQVCNSLWIIAKIKTREMCVWAKFAKISSRENFYLYSTCLFHRSNNVTSLYQCIWHNTVHCTICVSATEAVHSGACWLIFSIIVLTWKQRPCICLSHWGSVSRAEKKRNIINDYHIQRCQSSAFKLNSAFFIALLCTKVWRNVTFYRHFSFLNSNDWHLCISYSYNVDRVTPSKRH